MYKGDKQEDLVLGRHDNLNVEVTYFSKHTSNQGIVHDKPIINMSYDINLSIHAAN